MANKYCNLDGTKKISQEYGKITEGFGKVESDHASMKLKTTMINTILEPLSTEVADSRGDNSSLSRRLDTINKRIDTIITTPVGVVTAQEIIDARSIYNSLGDRLTTMTQKINTIHFNIQDFGAVGDGVTDDTQAFHDAAEALANGGELFIPRTNHHYLVSTAMRFNNARGITIRSNHAQIKVRGDYPDTQYSSFPNFGWDSVFRFENCENIIVDGLDIHGNISERIPTIGESQNCLILMLSCINIAITDCVLEESMTDAIHFFRSKSLLPNKQAYIGNCTTLRCRRNNISLVDLIGGLIENSTFNYAGTIKGTLPMSGLAIETDGGHANVRDITIRNCVMEHNTKWGTYCGGQGSADIRYIDSVIKNNAVGCNIDWDNANVTITGCDVSENDVGIRIVGVGCRSITNTTLIKNNIGVVIFGDVDIVIRDCDFITNTTAGIDSSTETPLFVSGNVSIFDSRFIDNTSVIGAQNGRGCAVYLSVTNTADIIISNNHIESGVDAELLQDGIIIKNIPRTMNGLGNKYINTTRNMLFSYSYAKAPLTSGERGITTVYNIAPTQLINISHWVYNSSTGNHHAVGCGSGSTVDRPTLGIHEFGYMYRNTTTGVFDFWNGTKWV